MGRPINKRYLGVIASDATTDLTGENNFNAVVKVGANAESTTGIILSQRAETLFVVNDAGDGTGNQGSCRLVDKAVGALGDDEMVIPGYDAVGGTLVTNIRKLQNRTVIGFDNVRYNWTIEDALDTVDGGSNPIVDGNVLVITPVA